MLVGEPGIGKTRTAEELASYALQQDACVLWGRCHEQQGMPPYWPWVQLIRTYVRDRDTEKMRAEMGAGVGDIAELVPDVKERLPNVQHLHKLYRWLDAERSLYITTFVFKAQAAQRDSLKQTRPSKLSKRL